MAVVLLQVAAIGARHLPEHDLFIQLSKLKNTLRFLAGEEPITRVGLKYYDCFS